jgi:hypothetical protein
MRVPMSRTETVRRTLRFVRGVKAGCAYRKCRSVWNRCRYRAAWLRSTMMTVLMSLLLPLRGCLRTRAALHVELLALRHQIHVLQRSRPRRLRLTQTDRLLWVWISRLWHEWPAALVIVKPETVLAWHRRGFRLLWTWKNRRRVGRPIVPLEVRMLIRRMSGPTRSGAHRESTANC